MRRTKPASRSIAPRLDRLALAFVMLPLVAMTLAGCDGHLAVEGAAYEWVDPPAGAQSVALLGGDTLAPDIALRPLGDVEITLFSSPEQVGSDDPDDQYFQHTVTSEADGAFFVGFAAAPGRYDVAIQARHPDCREIVHVFHHDRTTPHTAIRAPPARNR